MKNSIKTITVSLIASVLFVGCGGGDDSTGSTAASVETGTFIDAPVKGLHYETATQKGVTDDNGHFKYQAGEEIEFRIGNLLLGKGKAGVEITPYTITENNETIATNIALLLQNFDGNRSNKDVLDLSELEDYNFSSNDLDLSASTNEIEAKISSLLQDDNFIKFIDDTNTTFVDADTAKRTMKNYIATYNYEFAIGRKGRPYVISTTFGYKEDNYIDFATLTSSHLQLVPKDDPEIVELPYTVEEGGILKVDWSSVGDPTDYLKVLQVTDDEIILCSRDTLDDAQSCSEGNMALVLNSSSDFIAQKNSSDSIRPGQLITSLSDLEGKMLYQLDSFATSLEQSGMKIVSGKIDRFSASDMSAEVENSPYTGYDYNVSFSNNVLTIDGYDTDGSKEFISGHVYKYDLSGLSFTAESFASEYIFDDKGIVNLLPDGFNITFSEGSSMYCPLLYGECWIDTNAMNSIKDALQQ